MAPIGVAPEVLAHHILPLLPQDRTPVLNRVMRAMLSRQLEIQIEPNLYFAARQFDEAISDYSEAIRINPGLAVGYLNRGLAHARKQQSAEALADATEALRLDPGDGPSRTLASRCAQYLSQPPDGWDGVHVMKTK